MSDGVAENEESQADKAPPSDFVGSVAHGLAVLRSFDHDHFQMTLSEVSARTGMTRAGARRYLLTLAHLGYVEQSGRLFRLTPKVLELGYAFMSTMPLADIAQPYLDRLTARTGEVSAIAVLDGREVVHLAVATPAQRQLLPKVTIGRRFNALYNSTGRVLTACRDDKPLEQQLGGAKLTKLTNWSIDNKAALLDELRRVREQGYAIVDQESEEGLRSLAVPIRNKQGRPVAAINIITNIATVSSEELTNRLLPVLHEAADELSRAIGSQSIAL
ncbi:IclR family transcriptional regulator domain-containing protein [Solimonas marina]|uniref:Helix-turn-helix domain-containing protein n=1 Tax=Solimonas marina TaxID=2714601 RepID=A0A969WBM8_9GAMM|nr:IclR family transcriptional regulator C-terminal domain-containing protein [Solimonas marina]NKF23578.1 helix-turn-helix domain-containing protein [Solimonas marina]